MSAGAGRNRPRRRFAFFTIFVRKAFFCLTSVWKSAKLVVSEMLKLKLLVTIKNCSEFVPPTGSSMAHRPRLCGDAGPQGIAGNGGASCWKGAVDMVFVLSYPFGFVRMRHFLFAEERV